MHKKVKENCFSMYMYTLDNTCLSLTLGQLCYARKLKLGLSQRRYLFYYANSLRVSVLSRNSSNRKMKNQRMRISVF